MKNVLVIGYRGNMGTRIKTILDLMPDVEVLRYDLPEREEALKELVNQANRILVATPTENHVPMLRRIAAHLETHRHGVPVLCEKPISTDPEELREALKLDAAGVFKLFMVNHYAYAFPEYPHFTGETVYGYYNTGKDGIAWDCIQILHLARTGNIALIASNPVWNCAINGVTISRKALDNGYVSMIGDFIRGGYYRLWGAKDIEEAHEKARRATNENAEFHKKNCANSDTMPI